MATMTGIPAQMVKYIDNLRNIVRDKSLECLKLIMPNDNVTISEIPNHDDFLYAETLGFILIHGQPLKITFKIHYFNDVASRLVAKNLGVPRVEEESTRDFMREYCNMAAGYVVDVLNANKINTNISIPLITSGFDEIWFSDVVRSNEYRDWWQFDLDQGSFVAGLSIEVRDYNIIAQIVKPKAKGDDEVINFL